MSLRDPRPTVDYTPPFSRLIAALAFTAWYASKPFGVPRRWWRWMQEVGMRGGVE